MKRNEFNYRHSEHYDYPQLSIFTDTIAEKNRINKRIQINSKNIVIYIHIPFCRGYCIFCNYYKEPLRQNELLENYIDSLVKEIQNYGKLLCDEDYEIKAVHFGGGTPSVLSYNQINRLYESIIDNFIVSKECLVSFETSVKDLACEDYTHSLIETPINRISFGVQTFCPKLRSELGLCNERMIFQSVEYINKYGIQDYNVDIMYNLPNQKPADVIKDIKDAFDLGVNCIDLYALNVYPNTIMYSYLNKKNLYNKFNDSIFDYLKVYEFLQESEDIAMVMSNTISKKTNTPNDYLKYHLGGNKYEDGQIIGIGASARGYIGGYAYKNSLDIKSYIQSVEEKGHSRYLEKQLTSEEKINRTLVMFPNYTYILKENCIFDESNKIKMNMLLENGIIKEDNVKYYVDKKDCFWAGNLSSLFFSDEQKGNMINTILDNMKNKLNFYNQDSMQIIDNTNG